MFVYVNLHTYVKLMLDLNVPQNLRSIIRALLYSLAILQLIIADGTSFSYININSNSYTSLKNNQLMNKL